MPLLSTLATGSGEAIGLGTSLEIDERFANVNFVLPNIRGTSVNTSAFIDSGTANTGSTGFTVNKFGNTFMGSVTPYWLRGLENQESWSYEFFGGGAASSTPPYSTIGSITFPTTVLTANVVGWTSRVQTIECWLKPKNFSYASFGIALSVIVGSWDLDGDGRFIWGLNTSGQLSLVFASSAGQFSYTTTAALNSLQWNHAAVVVDGIANTATMFVNGVGQTFSINLGGQAAANSTTYFGISRASQSSTVVNYIGKMSNFRWSNTQVYTSNFTPPTRPLTLIHPNVTHLLTLQNPNLIDSSITPKSLEPGTNVQVSNDSPFQKTTRRPYDPLYHGGSAYFDGSTGYLTINDNATLEIGGSNFTLECMFLPLTNTSSTLFGKRANTSTVGSMIVSYSGTGVTVNIGTGATYGIASGINVGIPKKGVWNHLALYRVGNVWRGALNGVVATLSSSASAIGDVGAAWHFGGDTNGNYFNGYMTDIRLVVGNSIYSQTTVGAGITVPTAPLTNVGNTRFLLSMSNFTYADPTGKNPIGVIGTVPLANTPSKWGYSSLTLSRTSGAINSIFVPDTPSLGINLSKTVINPATGAGTSNQSNNTNFTIEMWFYPTSLNVTTNYGVIVQKDGLTTSTGMWKVALTSANTGNVVFSASSQSITSNTAVVLNSWNHIACQRNSGYYTVYINGILSANAAISAEMYPSNRTLNINYVTNGLANAGVDGYLSDLRILSGNAVYTGTTVAMPTGPFGNQ